MAYGNYEDLLAQSMEFNLAWSRRWRLHETTAPSFVVGRTTIAAVSTKWMRSGCVDGKRHACKLPPPSCVGIVNDFNSGLKAKARIDGKFLDDKDY